MHAPPRSADRQVRLRHTWMDCVSRGHSQMYDTAQVNPAWRPKPPLMPIRAVTFDVYSALFDTPAGLAEAIGARLRQRGAAGDPAALARAWRQKHFEFLLLANALEREPARNRTALEASARFTLRGLNPPLADEDLHALVGAWERLPPWPEAAAVLEEVRRRPLVLATLSNGDEEMLAALLRTLPVRFDHLISTQGGRFKPHPSIYGKALETLGVSSGELLHVAGSANDAMGATAAGIRTLWINRTGEPVLDPRYAPAHEGRDLRSVRDLLDALEAQNGDR